MLLPHGDATASSIFRENIHFVAASPLHGEGLSQEPQDLLFRSFSIILPVWFFEKRFLCVNLEWLGLGLSQVPLCC